MRKLLPLLSLSLMLVLLSSCNRAADRCASLTVVARHQPSLPAWPIEKAATTAKLLINGLAGLPVGRECQLQIGWTTTEWTEGQIKETESSARWLGITPAGPPKQLGLYLKVTKGEHVLHVSKVSMAPARAIGPEINKGLQQIFRAGILASSLDPYAHDDQKKLGKRLCTITSRENIFSFLKKLPDDLVISGRNEEGDYPARLSLQTGGRSGTDEILEASKKTWHYDARPGFVDLYRAVYPDNRKILDTQSRRSEEKSQVYEDIDRENVLYVQWMGFNLDANWTEHNLYTLIHDFVSFFFYPQNGILNIIILTFRSGSESVPVTHVESSIIPDYAKLKKGQRIYCHYDLEKIRAQREYMEKLNAK
jgi:hypothetical protein